MTYPDPLLDACIARLAATLDAADETRDLARHIRRAPLSADLAWVRWAAQCETMIGVTAADRQAVADACSRLSELVFDRPNAPDPATIRVAPMTRSLEQCVADLVQRAGRWRAEQPEDAACRS